MRQILIVANQTLGGEELLAIVRARRDVGATVDGEVGDEDPMQAIEKALNQRHFEEIVISTLPTHLARWLHTDLPSRAHRTFHVEVTTATAQAHH